MNIATDATIEAIEAIATEIEYQDGQANYLISLTAGGFEADLRCWAVFGWLAPGASQDLDGSALGSPSSAATWAVADSDGFSSGRPSVAPVCDDVLPGDPILIYGAEGDDDRFVEPSHIPQWADAVSAYINAPSKTEGEAFRHALSVRAEIARLIAEALEAARPQVPEPSAEEVFADAGEIYGLGDLPIRAGDWFFAGPVLAWRTADGDYEFRPYPDDDDIDAALEAAKSDAHWLIADMISAATPVQEW